MFAFIAASCRRSQLIIIARWTDNQTPSADGPTVVVVTTTTVTTTTTYMYAQLSPIASVLPRTPLPPQCRLLTRHVCQCIPLRGCPLLLRPPPTSPPNPPAVQHQRVLVEVPPPPRAHVASVVSRPRTGCPLPRGGQLGASFTATERSHPLIQSTSRSNDSTRRRRASTSSRVESRSAFSTHGAFGLSSSSPITPMDITAGLPAPAG